MTEELNEGTAYLLALKKATSAQFGAAAAPAREQQRVFESASTAPKDESFQGAEKRRSHRYKCEGSAEVREDGCEVRTWATFSDISLHGCYVEAQATYPAGTLLYLKLEANGVRVETQGKVRISYPYLGMGIAFEGMSDENAIRLKQLLAGLSCESVTAGREANTLHATSGSIELMPAVTNPEAAVRAVVEFFETSKVLKRDEFVKLLKKTQK